MRSLAVIDEGTVKRIKDQGFCGTIYQDDTLAEVICLRKAPCRKHAGPDPAFTWDDVRLLRRLEDYSWERAVGEREHREVDVERQQLDSIADRIERLIVRSQT